MKREIKEVLLEIKVLRVTTTDERWYIIEGKDHPSSTWIAGCYPKGIGFYKWLAEHGWDEAEAIKVAAGDKGSKVHQAISLLIGGAKLSYNSLVMNPSTAMEEELSVEEWEYILSFCKWWEETKPRPISFDGVVYNPTVDYAGTLDLLCEINGETWIIDFKTSQYLWPEHELQISSYLHALDKPARLGILQIGYRKNKAGFKFTEVEDKFSLFLAAREIWQNEHGNEKPKQKDYPLELILSQEKEKENGTARKK